MLRAVLILVAAVLAPAFFGLPSPAVRPKAGQEVMYTRPGDHLPSVYKVRRAYSVPYGFDLEDGDGGDTIHAPEGDVWRVR